jgi:diguanylate cyclase (GGDEF)-like protein
MFTFKKLVDRRRDSNGVSMPLRLTLLAGLFVAIFTLASSVALMRLADDIEHYEHDLADLWRIRVSLGTATLFAQRYGARSTAHYDDRRMAEEAWSEAMRARATFLSRNSEDHSLQQGVASLDAVFTDQRLDIDRIWSSMDIDDVNAARGVALSDTAVSELQSAQSAIDALQVDRADQLRSARQTEHDWLFALLAMFTSGVMLAVASAWVTWKQAASSALRSAAYLQGLRKLAFRDPLTRLANRRLLDQSFERAREFADRTGSDLFVAVIDLDRFKDINDRFGHHAGDHVLVEVARRLRAECGDFDTVARAGGDEFIVLLQDTERLAEQTLITTLRGVVNRPTEYNGVSIEVSASIGVVRYPRDGSTLAALTEHADKCMYHDKASAQMRGRPSSRFNATLLER